MCGVATHAVGRDAGYGLLHIQESKVHATFFELGIGWILESDISSIAAIDCNDRYIKDFIGYKYSTYACYINGNTIEKNDISSNFQFVAWAMPAKKRKVV